MATYVEANQVRLSLKMKLSIYSWYSACGVFSGNGDYFVVVSVKKINNQVRKLIPPVINGISVKTELIC